MKKALQIDRICGPDVVYQNGAVGAGALRDSPRRPFATSSRSSSSSIAAASAGGLRELARRSAPGRPPAACSGLVRIGLRDRPRREPERGRRVLAERLLQPAEDLRRVLRRARTPRPTSVTCDVQRPVARRTAPATRCARSPRPTAAGQAASELRHPRGRAEARSSRAHVVADRLASRGVHLPGRDLEQLVRLGRQRSRRRSRSRASARRGDAARRGSAGGPGRAPRARRRAGGAAARRAARRSASASASRSASTASRCSPCEPKLRRSRVAGDDRDVVEVRAERRSRRARGRGRAAPRAPRRSAARPS